MPEGVKSPPPPPPKPMKEEPKSPPPAPSRKAKVVLRETSKAVRKEQAPPETIPLDKWEAIAAASVERRRRRNGTSEATTSPADEPSQDVWSRHRSPSPDDEDRGPIPWAKSPCIDEEADDADKGYKADDTSKGKEAGDAERGVDPPETGGGASSGDGWRNWSPGSDWSSAGWVSAKDYWAKHSKRWTRQDWEEWRDAHPDWTPPVLPQGVPIPVDLEKRKALFIAHGLCRWCGVGTHWGNECPERPEDEKPKKR